MKHIKQIFFLMFLLIATACSDDEANTDFVDNADAPTNLSAIVTITQDNSGKVTIRPNGNGVTKYDIFFGDATIEPAIVYPGQTTEHTYAEGEYTLKIVGMGINGKTAEHTQQITVSFLAPQNLQINASPQVGNPYIFNVTASAEFETYFEVTFGDDPAATPIQFNEGQSVAHTYTAIGTYTITVTAYSGGAATAVETTEVTVFDPLLLPLNFESTTLNYGFGEFGGAAASVVANPSVSGINTSSRAARLVKNPGAETWAGIALPLDQPIDFTSQSKISIKTYSPIAGAVIKLKLENLSNADINTELDAVTTVANEWETLTYDFTGINSANNYQRIVIFYDFGNTGTGASFYFDDVMQTSGAPQIILPLTFQDASLTYTFTSFGGANTTVENNPDASGINSSSKVARLVKNSGAETWAGSFIELQQPIDFSSLSKIKMKTWSPAAGIVVKLKLENLTNSSINIELDAVSTVAGGWEELTYDFAGIVNANQYQRVVVFFDFGTPGTGASYYFDDIKLSN